MQMLTVEDLVGRGIFVQEEEDASIERDGYISYLIDKDYEVIIYNTETCTDRRITYVQLCERDEHINNGDTLWVLQTEDQDNPINIELDVAVNFIVYKRIVVI